MKLFILIKDENMSCTDFWIPFICVFLCVCCCCCENFPFGMQWGNLITQNYLITGEVSQLDVSSRGRNNIKTQSNGGNVKQKERNHIWRGLGKCIAYYQAYTYTVMLRSSNDSQQKICNGSLRTCQLHCSNTILLRENLLSPLLCL